MKPWLKFLFPTGMLSVVFYFIHVFLGQILWQEYNWVTMDISSLTAQGAPHAGLLSAFALTGGILSMLFFAGMVILSYQRYGRLIRAGYILFLLMTTVSTLGYALFPLEGDKTVMTFTNLMHIVVTALVVLLILSAGYILAAGYLKTENKKAGRVLLLFAVLITLFGALNPLGMSLNWNILGITERLNIFTYQLLVFLLSMWHTFPAAGPIRYPEAQP